MSTPADEIDNQISAGRREIQRSLGDVREREMPDVPPALVAAGVVTGVVAIGIVGWMIYRSRRRLALPQRLQDALPGSVGGLRQRLRARVRRAR